MRIRNLIIVLTLTLLISVSGYAFEYSWTYDGTPLGQESYTPAEPIQLEIKGTAIDLNSGRAAIDLKQKYNVHLSDEFTDTQAAMMRNEFQKFASLTNDIRQKQSIWHIIDSDIHLPNNVLIYSPPDRDTVLISESVFDYNIAEIDGIRGESQSMDLFHAIVRYVTDNGEKWTAGHILFHRYGVDIQVFGDKFEELTKYTTGETHTSFERFKPEELVKLIFMLEQFPTGMHKTAGLNYIIRRRDGLSHPLYPDAPAVAWTTSGYIEFMESAFTTVDIAHIHRLILHEKAHFLWEHVFDDQLKEDWAELGGWYKEGDKWYTTHQTDFVSAYAHGHNPDEDMAETISYYIVNPDNLRTHAPEKYAFVQNRIMHGTRYISTIRKDLTFEVYNLWPEYVYPGKVISTHIRVEGEPEEDKTVYITFVTHSENESDHGKKILFRLFSRIGTHKDIYLHAVDVDGNRTENSNIYTRTFKMSKHMPSGY